MSKSTLCRCVDEVLDFLESIAPHEIIWPEQRNEMHQKALLFYEKFGKPCTIGCVDGTHIAILRPHRQIEADYLNRKIFHSINVMVNFLNQLLLKYQNLRAILIGM